jgi:lipopolysaccharide/colanic/teichoic acid biosynthesis glycosyltransferase
MLAEGARRQVTRQILNEDLFKGVLTRERRRSDRSNQSVLLLRLSVKDGLVGDSSLVLDRALDALLVNAQDTDIVGWLDEGSVLGVILSEVRGPDVTRTCDAILTHLRRAVGKTFRHLSIRFHVYPEPKHPGEEGRWPVDPILYPDLTPPGRWTRYDAVKRGLDIAISLTLLTAFSPLILLIAALVKCSSHGSVMFKQARVGRMMKPFTMFKFRTMYSNGSDKLHRDYVSSFIKAGNRVAPAARDGVFKLADDPRVTPIGSLLRKTSLDELPQLWNVLRGDMSLVGPRPPLPYEVEQYEAWHRCRILEAQPGVTGLWQVTGRSRTTFDEMVRLDLRYVRTRSLWTDIRILLATPAAVLSGKGAR